MPLAANVNVNVSEPYCLSVLAGSSSYDLHFVASQDCISHHHIPLQMPIIRSVGSKTEGAYGQLIIGATWQLTMACAFTAASCLHLVSLHPNPNANHEVTTAKGASLLATGVPLITKRAVWVHCDDLHFLYLGSNATYQVRRTKQRPRSTKRSGVNCYDLQ